ncbi:MAG: PE domain-containing protein [Gordonia sp. (in: high G+C Gram-positive bacteria)]|uniref:PE domain-containing protein n=1 Tax=Gordonia sp. (in: high G+C Gram-positive bacteria) TaxID=84139 RepID=UPI0039E5F632
MTEQRGTLLTADVAAMRDTAAALDRLAGRLAEAVDRRAQRLSPAPAGDDEVSRAVAAALSAAGGGLVADASAGAAQVSACAAALRSQARAIVDADALSPTSEAS